MTAKEEIEFYKTVKIMKCGDCTYIKDVTQEWHKRKVYRCGFGTSVGYKVGLSSECHLVHRLYYKEPNDE